jgi:hypothetical protein
MRRAIIPALLLVLVSVVLGATVFREQVAAAASNLNVFVTKEERVRRNGSGLAFVHRTTGECDKADA